MDKPNRNAIEVLTDCLAAMTYRAITAEQELDEVREYSNMWYQRLKERDAQLEEANQQITALLEKLAEAEKKGATDNGKND